MTRNEIAGAAMAVFQVDAIGALLTPCPAGGEKPDTFQQWRMS
jgi:hypothetical protein